MRILAATDFSSRSQRALQQAGVLARVRGAKLTVVHVVDDDQPARLVDLEKREAERYLVEQRGALAQLQGLDCRLAVAAGEPFDGILRTAESMGADLIVMGAHRKQVLRDIFTGTTLERVIRTGSFPVLMVNDEAATSYQRILAAVDRRAPSLDALRTAKTLQLLDGAHLTLVHAFDAVARGRMANSGVETERIDAYVADERRSIAAELETSFASNQFDIDDWSLRVIEGHPSVVIARSVEKTAADLVIVGTHGRTGLSAFFLGSVTLEVVRSVKTDILAVPVR